MYVNIHNWPANWHFGPGEHRNHYQLWWVAFRDEVASPLKSAVCVYQVEVCLFLRVSIVTADTLPCHFGNEGIRQLGFDEASLGVYLSQPSPFVAEGTQHPASSPLRPQHEVVWSGIAFPILRHAKSLLWPFSPHSRPGTCRTVPTAPDLLALPL